MRKPGLKILLSILVLLVEFNPCYAMTMGNGKVVDQKQSISDSIVLQIFSIEKDRVIKSADGLLKEKPRTVTSSSSVRSSGGKHDFFSEGPYWWPDPTNPAGPYIRKDGIVNPDRFKDHDVNLRHFSWIVGTETSAYMLTGKEKYAQSAMKHLTAWFIDTTTRMDPNMLYAQAIKGICTGRGTGIIDAVPLIDVARSVMILEKSPYVSGKDIALVKEWFKQFISWLTTHQYGIDEMNAKNNHGTWWNAQLAAYARLVDDQKVLQLCNDHYRNVILPGQMAADGSFPLELERTKPYSYSLFNLEALASLAWTLTDTSFDAWNYSLPDGRGMQLGLKFIKPYILDKSKWPYKKDVDHWDEQPHARQFMLFEAMASDNSSWLELWESLSKKNKSDENRISQSLKNPLLWVDMKINNYK